MSCRAALRVQKTDCWREGGPAVTRRRRYEFGRDYLDDDDVEDQLQMAPRFEHDLVQLLVHRAPATATVGLYSKEGRLPVHYAISGGSDETKRNETKRNQTRATSNAAIRNDVQAGPSAFLLHTVYFLF